jgi:peptidoglycan hydrolase-like protein with peptidoglycan-binding domain
MENGRDRRSGAGDGDPRGRRRDDGPGAGAPGKHTLVESLPPSTPGVDPAGGGAGTEGRIAPRGSGAIELPDGGVSQPPRLAIGQSGTWVRTLQTLLTAVGDTLACDGIFGGKTHGAVVRYQRENALGADGIVGPLTWGSLLGVSFGSGGEAGVSVAARGPAGIGAGVDGIDGGISAGVGAGVGSTSAGVGHAGGATGGSAGVRPTGGGATDAGPTGAGPEIGGELLTGSGPTVGAGFVDAGVAPPAGGSLSFIGASMGSGFGDDLFGGFGAKPGGATTNGVVTGGSAGGGTTTGTNAGGAAGGVGSLADLGLSLSSAIEHLLTLAFEASGLSWAMVLPQLNQILHGQNAASPGRIAIVLIQVAIEVATLGPYGPAWADAVAAGILPPLPTFSQQQAARIEFYANLQRWPEAFRLLHDMKMLDIVDVLRVVKPSTRSELDANFDAGTKGLDGPRLRAAFDTAPGKHGAPGKVGAIPADLPPEEAAVLTGYSNLRDWPALLPLAGRGQGQHIKTNGVTPPPGKAQVEIPDLGQRKDTLPPDQQAMVELIARHRERLPSRAAELKAHSNNKGYQYNSHQSGLTPAGLQGDPKARTPGITAERQREIDTAIWTEFQSEGGVGSINTYDSQVVTWGHGLGAKNGVLRDTMPRLFAHAPDVRDLLLDAGFTFGPSSALDPKGKPAPADWLWVNTATGRIETGADALELLRLDTQMLTLLMNIAEDRVPDMQGTNFGQAFEDATQESITAHEAGRVPASMAHLPDLVLRFCAHCIWGGNARWKNFEAAGVTTVAEAARDHATRVGKPHLGGIRVGGVWGIAMRTFANHAVMSEGQLLPGLPEGGFFPGVVWLVGAKNDALQLLP